MSQSSSTAARGRADRYIIFSYQMMEHKLRQVYKLITSEKQES